MTFRFFAFPDGALALTAATYRASSRALVDDPSAGRRSFR